MAWFQGHKTVWRMAILVLLLVALLGPWWYDLINVPAKYHVLGSLRQAVR